MKRFADLCAVLETAKARTIKLSALSAYFNQADEMDRLWAITCFLDRGPSRIVTQSQLRDWAIQTASIPLWLFEESNRFVGDVKETCALILPPPADPSDHNLSHWITQITLARGQENTARQTLILTAWKQLETSERLLFNNLLTGSFHAKLSQHLLTQALSQVTGQNAAELAYRLSSNWTPHTTNWHNLIFSDNPAANRARPYPTGQTAPRLDRSPASLGAPTKWHAEWKWDGVASQLILRARQHVIWSNEQTLLTDTFPELARALDFLPDGTVIDGEILAWDGTHPLPFSALQKRIGRKSIPKSLQRDIPVVMLASDLLEYDHQDQRDCPFQKRRSTLTQMLAPLPPECPIRLAPQIPFRDWNELTQIHKKSRAHHAQGILLNRLAQNPTPRESPDRWLWPQDPLRIDAVLIYAQAGRRGPQISELTCAVWSGNNLVPLTRATSALSDAETSELTAWVRKNTQQRFGPVRQVPPEQVFEITFDNIHTSPRHKSGLALLSPRITRWHKGKPPQHAATLAHLTGMLPPSG